jgi:acylphosphatase
VFAGPPAAVNEVTDACRRGPPGARVDSVDEREATEEELALCRSQRFAVLPTV